ncbi:hypothetical protein L2E82_28938 [Cichorium intybus]|uniref:Uncharacterized protein n=1 Tax=Cichorium intybus TaxID=13427 RepID=A0ACB9CX88_CICIN|nr:hypothetical protein L2E82_28938 [Cichorium intybus]
MAVGGGSIGGIGGGGVGGGGDGGGSGSSGGVGGGVVGGGGSGEVVVVAELVELAAMVVDIDMAVAAAVVMATNMLDTRFVVTTNIWTLDLSSLTCIVSFII